MVSFASFFKGRSAVEQIVVWNLVQALVSGALAPYIRELENCANAAHQSMPIEPEVAAKMVIRNVLSMEAAVGEAVQNGVTPGDFAHLVEASGNSLGPGELAAAVRRGIIPEHGIGAGQISFEQGIAEGDLKNKWGPVVRKLATMIPSPADVLDAYLEGQIEEADARQLYETVGGAPEYFTLLYNTRGQAPTPIQAGEMANRGIIPWRGHGAGVVSFEQAFLEGPWRNKWLEPFLQSVEYRPPPRTITALVHEGVLSDEQAIKLWIQTGLTAEMAGVYLASAKHQGVTAHRQLALSTIEQLYEDHAISKANALSMIGELGYTPEQADFIIAVRDLKLLEANINRGISTIHARYIGHRIDRSTASAALDSLGVDAQQRDWLLQVWDEERKATVALLTPAEIRKAANTGLIPPEEALRRLIERGYDVAEAALYLQL